MSYLYIALFFFLTPGILVRLPPGGSKYMVALVHAVIFGLLTMFIQARKSNDYGSSKKY
jgi:hypothetical protein